MLHDMDLTFYAVIYSIAVSFPAFILFAVSIVFAVKKNHHLLSAILAVISTLLFAVSAIFSYYRIINLVFIISSVIYTVFAIRRAVNAYEKNIDISEIEFDNNSNK
jgi:hypothetical protein